MRDERAGFAVNEQVQWREDDERHSARWLSASELPPPEHVKVVDDGITATAAHRLARNGNGLLWRGDYHNARQLLTAMGRRFDRPTGKRRRTRTPPPANAAEAFDRQRRERSARAEVLNRLLVPYEPGWTVPLRRAPDARAALTEAYGPLGEPAVGSLRELLGAIGAHEWRRNGVDVPALNDRVVPHYGVFAPVRGEYVDLVAQAPLPSSTRAFDIGTGTGVLAAVLARRGVESVVGTDSDPRALACARDNLARLVPNRAVEVVEADLFPAGRAPLIVCNPPWVPAQPVSRLDTSVYDPDGQMLRGFLDGLADHLERGGEGWLVLSDLAEHLGLRSRDDLLQLIAQGGLRVVDRLDTRPRHRRARDSSDPLHAARAAEVTSLWRLAPAR